MLNEFTPSEKKVFKIMFYEPFDQYSLSYLKKKSQLSYMSIFRAVKKLKEKNIVKDVSISGKKFMCLNLENKKSLKLFELFEVEKQLDFKEKSLVIWKIVNEISEKSIEKLGQNLSLIILFGSAARKELRKESDIDILFVVNSKKIAESKIKDVLSKTYSYKREINPIIITLKEFIDGIKQEKDFFKTLWKDRIIFYGESLFWREVVRCRK
ncbi:MAG: nucleotidyltransferase domain-containing protein [Candidatus Aenigmarchaeota archaeon]|nr:nucleotidyltransferase domain-containing protein [Candidatus Aenigmarchaeota archaeon]